MLEYRLPSAYLLEPRTSSSLVNWSSAKRTYCSSCGPGVGGEPKWLLSAMIEPSPEVGEFGFSMTVLGTGFLRMPPSARKFNGAGIAMACRSRELELSMLCRR